MTDSLEPAFLSAIQADPDNASPGGPRHIYADWLEEQGDPRCELLRLAARIRQFPKATAFHQQQFDTKPYDRKRYQCENWSNDRGWFDTAMVPHIWIQAGIPGWWMWTDTTCEHDPDEFLRQVEALTNQAQPLPSISTITDNLPVRSGFAAHLVDFWRLGDPPQVEHIDYNRARSSMLMREFFGQPLHSPPFIGILSDSVTGPSQETDSLPPV